MKQDRTLNRISATLKQYRTAMKRKDFDKAVRCADTLVKHMPDRSDPFACRAEAHYRARNFVGAANDFGQAHLFDPQQTKYLNRFGDALVQAGDREAAETAFLGTLKIDPLDMDALLAMGQLCEMSGRTQEASNYILKAVESHPGSARACHSAGRFMHLYGDRQVAMQFFSQAIVNDPDLPEPYRVLANYLRDVKETVSAIKLYDALLERVPDDQVGLAERAHCLAHINDWDHPGYVEFDPATEAQFQIAAGPWMYLAMEDDPANLLRRCRTYAQRMLENATETPLEAHRNGKIRIGYFSADFHDHATMHLLAGVLEAHDKSKFEIYAYSFGPDKADEMRARTVAAADKFINIAAMPDYAAAQLARSHELDVAIDLKGFTANMRLGIFAHRVAPVQATWLGFPGSTGADCMDYIIADEVVIPPELEEYYSEKVLALPGSYQPNDQSRPLPDPTVTRASQGLPEDAVVFASFNNVYKISPEEFDIWMKLLREVEGSVLWQLTGGAESTANLRKAAEERGIDPERLIFAPRLKQGPHLSRLALADIFLDTFNCNAHTTASDALWAGVPVVTAPGRQFAARVAASLVTAAGTPETICDSREAYYDCALSLARNADARAELRDRLIAGRTTSPLFDTVAFTRNLESALAALFQDRD